MITAVAQYLYRVLKFDIVSSAAVLGTLGVSLTHWSNKQIALHSLGVCLPETLSPVLFHKTQQCC